VTERRRSAVPARPRGPARTMNAPEIGFYRLRLTKGAVDVAARIHRTCACTVHGGEANAEHAWRDGCDRFPPLRGEIDGQPCDPNRIWESKFERIPEAEFLFLRDDAKWCRDHAPETPQANPEKPIDLLTVESPF